MIPKEFPAEEAEYWLDELAQGMESGSFAEAFTRIVPNLQNAFGDNFERAEGPSGDWAPHAPYTIAKYGPHPLLILSGDLLRSVTETGEKGSVQQIGEREMALGTSLFYAGWQQRGTSKIPPRPFLWLDDSWSSEIVDEFATGVVLVLFGGP